MKKIIITQRRVKDPSFGEVRDALSVEWGKLFQALGFLPIAFPSNFPPSDFINAVKPDGILLSGGNDLSRISRNLEDQARDEMERNLLEVALAQEIPVLGVCRGMQVIGEYFGSTVEPLNGHVKIEHSIDRAPASESKFFPEDGHIRQVNSYHNYGFREVRAPLRPVWLARDGSVEAFAHEKLAIAAMMWHPERSKELDPQDLRLFQRIFS